MSYCTKCGSSLITRYLKNEGDIPYCEKCGEFRFPSFNTAISAIIYEPEMKKLLLVKQYGRDRNVLVAGYVSKGENSEETLVREVREETGLEVVKFYYNTSRYYEKTNTLMINYACVVKNADVIPNDEIDSFEFFDEKSAVENIAKGSLAEEFLLNWLAKQLHN